MSDIDESSEKKGLTRRAFLGHAAVGAAGVAVGSSILGVPSALASGSDWSQVDAENIVWDKEVDAIFVGTGYASLCAAIEAYDAGTTDILIIDKAKANAIGGNSILCNGSAQFAGTVIEKDPANAATLVKYPQTATDTTDMMVEDSLVWGDFRANQDVLKAVTALCPETVLWLRDHLGLAFNPVTTFQYGMRDNDNANLGPVGHVARTHQAKASTLPTTDPNWYPGAGGISYWYVMYNYLKKKGIALGDRMLTEHKAVRFIQAGADGPVVGLEVQDIAAGKTLNIRTRKGVVLGAGGWKSNVAMRVNWDPRLDADFAAGGMPYVESTGEMIMAANDIGADLTGMDFVCEFRVKWGTKIYQHWFYDITKSVDGAGLSVSHDNGMCVGANGKRFIDEYTSNTIDAQDFCESFANMQKPRAVWFVCSDDKVTPTSNWRTSLANPTPDVSPCVSAGMIYSDATVAGLAAKMGVDASNLAAEIDEVQRLRHSQGRQRLRPSGRPHGRPDRHVQGSLGRQGAVLRPRPDERHHGQHQGSSRQAPVPPRPRHHRSDRPAGED